MLHEVHSEVLEGTRRALRGHSEGTQRSLRGHSEVTQRALTGHTKVTQRSLRGHSYITHPPLVVLELHHLLQTGHHQLIRTTWPLLHRLDLAHPTRCTRVR